MARSGRWTMMHNACLPYTLLPYTTPAAPPTLAHRDGDVAVLVKHGAIRQAGAVADHALGALIGVLVLVVVADLYPQRQQSGHVQAGMVWHGQARAWHGTQLTGRWAAQLLGGRCTARGQLH